MKRRQFLKQTGGWAAGLALPSFIPAHAMGRGCASGPNGRIVMGCIGVGSMGSGHVRSFLGYDFVHVAAVCDVRREHRERARETVNRHYGDEGCKAYSDFRELLARPDIDAVCIAVPDHWHAIIGIEAARRGKHMYYEKPMGRSIAEARAVREAVKGHGVVFQFGTQQRSDKRFRFACELVRNGKIGVLKTVMAGSADYKPIPDQPEQPVPEGFDYDAWLGPAPWAPYTAERCTRNWTLIYDYSLGCVSGAWGIHHVDIAQWAIGEDGTGPVRVEGTGFFPSRGLYDTALSWEVEHAYACGARMIHMDMHTALKRADQFKLGWMGILFLGTEGWVYTSREFLAAYPESLLKIQLGASDLRFPSGGDHRGDFLEAVRTGRRPVCPVESAVSSDTVCHLDDIAMRLRRPLTWDPVRETFRDDGEADRMMARPMRSPWRL